MRLNDERSSAGGEGIEAAGGPLPVVVWIHGGALITGSRAGVPPHLLGLARNGQAAVVSIDYRLFPPVTAPGIIDDLRDAFRWVRSDVACAAELDGSRVVVVGASAGGYLTVMSGPAAEPKPLALVAYHGYGDVDGLWYTQPSGHYLAVLPIPLPRSRPRLGGMVRRIEAEPREQMLEHVGRRQQLLDLRVHLFDLCAHLLGSDDPIEASHHSYLARCYRDGVEIAS